MAQNPNHPLIRSYINSRPSWSGHSARVAISVLNRFARWARAHDLDLLDVGRGDCRAYIAERTKAVAGSTAHKDWQHLGWFYAFLIDDGELDLRPAQSPMANVEAPKMSDPDPERTGHIDEVTYRRLMSTFDKRSLAECRDAAICSLMYWSGLRRSEVVRLDVDRIQLAEGLGQVIGKNGKWRTFPISTETAEWLGRYLRRRERIGDTSTALFASLGGSGSEHTTSGRLQPNGITLMLNRRCDRAGIERVSPHRFRRGMAIAAKGRGVSDSAIMRAAGWTDPRMLARYTREEADRLAVDEFHALDPTRRTRTRPIIRRRAG